MAADQGGRLTWYIDSQMKYVGPGQGGTTIPLDDGKRAAISLSPIVFTDARILYITVAHELVHARDILNGNYLQWTFDFFYPQTVDAIMEHHAYLRSAELEAQFGLPGISSQMLNTLTPLLPAGFSYDNYRK